MNGSSGGLTKATDGIIRNNETKKICVNIFSLVGVIKGTFLPNVGICWLNSFFDVVKMLIFVVNNAY